MGGTRLPKLRSIDLEHYREPHHALSNEISMNIREYNSACYLRIQNECDRTLVSQQTVCENGSICLYGKGVPINANIY